MSDPTCLQARIATTLALAGVFDCDPRSAQVVLQIADNPRFNAWVPRLACKQRQPVAIVQIGKLLPARSRIRSAKLWVEAV
jgi:hypothetical protein